MNTALASAPELASLSPSLFDDATRLYALRIAGMTAALVVVGFRAREALSDLYEYEVDLLGTDAHLELKHFLTSQTALSLTLADGTRAVRSGYIREAERLDSDGGLAAYRIRLVPWLWLASQQRHNRVFQDKTVLQIFEEVVGAYTPRVAWRAAPEVDAFLAQARVRSYTVQYRETDYVFVSRLLAEEGLGFCFRDISGAEAQKAGSNQSADNTAEPELGDAPLHELLLFADSSALPEDYSSLHQNGGRGIRFHRAASQEDQDGIQAFGAQRILQHATTTLASYDYKAKHVIGASVPTDHAYGGPNAPALESYDWVGTYAFADSAEAERAARLLREATEARNKTWIGQASVRTFRPGTCFDLTESPLDEGKAGQDSDRRFLLTEVHSRGVNNLPRELSQRAQALLGSEDLDAAALAHGYSAHISAIRASVPWRPVLTDGNGARLNPRPTASGVHSAVVVGADGQTQASGAEEIHTDKLGRIKVRFPWQQAQDSQDRSSCWLRVASRYAGAGHGAQFTPRIGQEVLVGFLEEDIDRPIVLGALYNGQGEGASPPTPGGKSNANTNPNVFALARDGSASAQGNLAAGNSPAWHGQGAGDEAHRHSGALTGFKTQGFGGSGYNQLVFDDSANQLRVQLATSQAASQLNLGHLLHQADNYRGSFRGQGFELRTDAYGAIRAGRGLILSTYQGSAPDASPEPAGDFAAGQALLKQAGQLAERFSQAAATHQTLKFAAHEGANQAGQSVIDEQGAPLKALHTAASGMVAGSALEAALQDASAKNTATGAALSSAAQPGSTSNGGADAKLPHFSDPLIGLAAKAGLGLIAGQSLQLANGETLTWGSGQDTNLAIGNQLHIHSGQALGMLAGAVAPGEANTGFKAVAAQGPIELQAQSDTLAIQARDQIDVLSAHANVDFAAAKSITLNVAGGASLTIADGNITFACPGTLTIHAGQKSFAGPTSLSYPLPRFPTNPYETTPPRFDFKLTDMPGPDGVALSSTPWRMVLAHDEAGALSETTHLMSGLSDDQGKLALSADQEKQLGEAYLSGKGVWVLFEGQIKQLEVTKEREAWTEQQKLEHALDSLGFADSFGLAAGEDSNAFAAPLARSELGNTANAVFDKFKKGV